MYRGATFNLAHTWQQMLHFRREIALRIWTACISWVAAHPGSGLPVIYESARITGGAAGRPRSRCGEAEAGKPGARKACRDSGMTG
ncbi:MAG: hypothetical protein U0792_02850 [Gemmataceae bacterium]